MPPPANDLLARAVQSGTPLIEGATATFVWQGERAPSIVGDFTHWHNGAPIAMQPAGPSVWAASLTFPRDAYLEYGFVLDEGQSLDPLNPRSADNGLAGTNNFFWMPDWADTPLAQPQPGAPVGQVSEHAVSTHGYITGAERTVYLYRPPAPGPCPLVVVLDGQNYLTKARLPVIVDNLIAQGRIRPIALALVANGGAARLLEYACSDANLAFLLDCVLPLARAHLPLSEPDAGGWGIMGASMGGLMSLYAALRAPEVFTNVLCESGAFGADHPDHRLYHRSVIEDLIDLLPPPPLRLWLDCGLHEWFLAPNRRMAARLRARGYAVAYHEQSSGHNYPSWRNVLWRGLLNLYGPNPHEARPVFD